MATQKNNITQYTLEMASLHRKLFALVIKHGCKAVEFHLEDMEFLLHRQNGLHLANRIKMEVCEAYQVSEYELYHSRKRGAIRDARQSCMLLFKEFLDISEGKIARHFRISPQRFSKIKVDFFNRVNSKVKWDIQFMKTYNNISSVIKAYVDFKPKRTS